VERITMADELLEAVFKAVEPYENRLRIFNVANVIENLAVAFPETSREVIADLVRQRAALLGATVLFKSPR
jgi:hypothetical protein